MLRKMTSNTEIVVLRNISAMGLEITEKYDDNFCTCLRKDIFKGQFRNSGIVCLTHSCSYKT